MADPVTDAVSPSARMAITVQPRFANDRSHRYDRFFRMNRHNETVPSPTDTVVSRQLMMQLDNIATAT